MTLGRFGMAMSVMVVVVDLQRSVEFGWNPGSLWSMLRLHELGL